MTKKITPQISGNFIIRVAEVYTDFNRAIMEYIDNSIDSAEKYFRNYCNQKDVNIAIYKSYPRSPKMNGMVERFNRTTQEEFYNYNQDLLFEDVESFNQKFMNWIFWFNTQRPHFSLNFSPPLKFYVQHILNKKSNMYWTCTLFLFSGSILYNYLKKI